MNSLNISILTSNGEPAWQSYINSHPDATIYHTLEWRDVLYNEYRFKPVYIMAREGDRVVGVLPMFLIKNFRGRRLSSLPFSIYGGPLGDSDVVVSALLAKCIEIVDEGKAKSLEIKPYKRISGVASLGFEELGCGEGVIMDLTLGLDVLWLRFAERFNVKKAEKKGLKFILTERDGLKAFYRLQLMTRKRLGLPTPGFNYYASFFEKMGNKVKLALVEKCGKVIAGDMFFLFKDNILLVLNASDHNYKSCKPNDFMIWNILKWGLDAGFKILDQGPALYEEEGLLHYKRKWGGDTARTYSYCYPVANKSATKSKGSFFFKVMPIGISGVVGSKVIKALG